MISEGILEDRSVERKTLLKWLFEELGYWLISGDGRKRDKRDREVRMKTI